MSLPSSPAADLPAALRRAFLDVRRAHRRTLARSGATVLACAFFAVASLASFHALDRFVVDSIWALAGEVGPPPLTRVLAVVSLAGAAAALGARVRLGAEHNVALALSAIAIACSAFLLVVVPFQINLHLQVLVDVGDQLDDVYLRAATPCELSWPGLVLVRFVGARTVLGVAALIFAFSALAIQRWRMRLAVAAAVIGVVGAAVFVAAAFGVAAGGIFCPIS
jgi:hypothetical protein